MSDTFQHVGQGVQLLVGRDEVRRPRRQIERGLVRLENLPRQRLQPTLPRDRGQRLLLGLVGEIQIFEPARRVGLVDEPSQLVGQLALRLDRLEDGRLALGQHPQASRGDLDAANLLFVQPARLVLAIARNEGDRVALVEQLDRALDLVERQTEPSGHLLSIRDHNVVSIQSSANKGPRRSGATCWPALPSQDRNLARRCAVVKDCPGALPRDIRDFLPGLPVPSFLPRSAGFARLVV